MKDYLAIFNQSYDRVIRFSDEERDFIERFYEIFIPVSREVSEKFKHTNMTVQKKLLRASLYYLVEFAATSQAGEYMEEIAQRHGKGRLDIKPELYDLWLESLLEAVREFDPEFDQDIELAWRIVLSPGIAYMKYHYTRTP